MDLFLREIQLIKGAVLADNADLSESDQIAVDHLVASGIYNRANAETYVLSQSEDQVERILEVLRNEKVNAAMAAVAATRHVKDRVKERINHQ